MDSEGKLRSQAELAAEILAARAKEKRRVVATAESLTGGLVSELITGVAGSSAWFDRGFVTYQPEAKVEMIDVPAEMIRTEGVVSEPVAEAMARGALASSKADLSVALTGVAGRRKRRSAPCASAGPSAPKRARSSPPCARFMRRAAGEPCGLPPPLRRSRGSLPSSTGPIPCGCLRNTIKVF